jgi:ribonuclease BN (tRNA processing enzyme)
MELTILGSGTLVPNAARGSASYFLELPDARLMLDCGAGSLHALSRYGLVWEELTHLFVSHFHIDHVGELASIFQAFKHGMGHPRSRSLTVVGPAGLDRLIEGLKQAFGENSFLLEFPVHLRLMADGERMQLPGGCHLAVAKTPHTPESIAVRIDTPDASLCYTGDTAFSEELAGFFSGADLLISECSFREPRSDGSSHLSIGEAAKMAAMANVRRLVVTHFYFDVDETALKIELQRDYPGEVIVGADGMRLTI